MKWPLFWDVLKLIVSVMLMVCAIAGIEDSTLSLLVLVVAINTEILICQGEKKEKSK